MLHRRRTLSDYLHEHKGQPAWALVTGASDGIGLGFAQELSSHGFNIILHGRNPYKLTRVQSTLQTQFPTREYKIFIHDAEKELTSEILQNLVESLQDINLTVLINNVGGAGSVTPAWRCFVERSKEDIDKYINMNVRFPPQITRSLLPHLIENHSSTVSFTLAKRLLWFKSIQLSMERLVKSGDESRELRSRYLRHSDWKSAVCDCSTTNRVFYTEFEGDGEEGVGGGVWEEVGDAGLGPCFAAVVSGFLA